MEKKDLQYIDSELKKIKIKDFEYVGMRKGVNSAALLLCPVSFTHRFPPA